MDNVMADVQAQFIGIQETPSQILKKLFFFSMLMILCPLATYFISKSIIFEGILGMSSMNSYFYGAVATIVAVHIFLAIFIYAAITEGPKPIRKKD
jgi:hypothetical protein